ncbi:MAG: hypothetical protein WCJ66_11210 [Verrucomicrobiota bacterium]
MKPRKAFVAGTAAVVQPPVASVAVETQSADATPPQEADWGGRTILIGLAVVVALFVGITIVPTQYAEWRGKRIESALGDVHVAAHNLAQSEHAARDDSSAKASVDYSRALADMEKAESLAYKVGATGAKVGWEKDKARQRVMDNFERIEKSDKEFQDWVSAPAK